ncbi:MAG: hypothetical protein AAF708_01450 [Deinococcota bacterium]
MKKLLVTGLAALAMAVSLAPQPEQGAITDTNPPIEYMLADGDTDTDGG